MPTIRVLLAINFKSQIALGLMILPKGMVFFSFRLFLCYFLAPLWLDCRFEVTGINFIRDGP